MANSWKKHFGGDPAFIYTVPAKSLAPKVAKPEGIDGASKGVEVSAWTGAEALAPMMEAILAEAAK